MTAYPPIKIKITKENENKNETKLLTKINKMYTTGEKERSDHGAKIKEEHVRVKKGIELNIFVSIIADDWQGRNVYMSWKWHCGKSDGI